MERAYHGGSCCGIQHIFSFGHVEPSQKKRLETLIKACATSSQIPLIEVALTDYQVNSLGWGKVLEEEFQFKRVASWRNPNGGNLLHLFILTREIQKEAEAAFEAKALAEKAEAERLAAEQAKVQAEIITEVLATAPKPRKRLTRPGMPPPIKKGPKRKPE